MIARSEAALILETRRRKTPKIKAAPKKDLKILIRFFAIIFSFIAYQVINEMGQIYVWPLVTYNYIYIIYLYEPVRVIAGHPLRKLRR